MSRKPAARIVAIVTLVRISMACALVLAYPSQIQGAAEASPPGDHLCSPIRRPGADREV